MSRRHFALLAALSDCQSVSKLSSMYASTSSIINCLLRTIKRLALKKPTSYAVGSVIVNVVGSTADIIISLISSALVSILLLPEVISLISDLKNSIESSVADS